MKANKRTVVSIMLLGFLLTAETASAIIHYWAAPSDGVPKSWSDASNWKYNLNDVATTTPGDSDIAWFSLSGVNYNGTVRILSDVTVAELRFLQNNTSAMVDFDIRSEEEPKTLTSAGNIQFNASNSRATISTGTIRTLSETRVGHYTSNNNNLLLVDADGTLASSNNVVVSLWGQNNNQLVVTNGGTIVCGASMILGNGPGSGNNMVISGPGSSATTRFHVTLGGAGSDSNTVAVLDGGVLNAGLIFSVGNGTLATDPSNWNRFRVDGANSRIQGGTLNIGSEGHSNRVDVLNSAVATFTTAITIGKALGNVGNGLVISNGAKVVFSGSSLTVNPDSYITCHVKNAPTGLDLGSASSLTVANGGVMHFRFEQDPEGISPFWGLRWQGAHSAALQTLHDSGKLTWETSVPGKVRLHYEAPYTYLSFMAYRGTVLTLR